MSVKSYDGYRSAIRAAVRAFWNGTWSWFDFSEEMFRAIRTGFTQAWMEGMSAAGITAEEMTDEERIRLEQEINRESRYVTGFADAIEKGSKANGGPLSALFRRVDLWAAGYDRIRSLAMTFAGNDPKYEWVMGPTKEHCDSCLKLNGRVYRASRWKAADLQPRSYKLSCHGFKCLCEFVATTKRCTPGPMPTI